jgi:hypothetical protein
MSIIAWSSGSRLGLHRQARTGGDMRAAVTSRSELSRPTALPLLPVAVGLVYGSPEGTGARDPLYAPGIGNRALRGALMLHLAIINLFVFLLRRFGRPS